MRRRLFPKAAIVALALGSTFVGADPATAAVRDFAGTASATFTFGSGPTCSGNGQIGSVSGMLARANRPTWKLTVAKLCVDAIGHQARFFGEARITTARHQVLYATLTGAWQAVGTVTATFAIDVHGGTGEFTHATGSISASGSLDFSTGRFTGSMTGAIATS